MSDHWKIDCQEVSDHWVFSLIIETFHWLNQWILSVKQQKNSQANQIVETPLCRRTEWSTSANNYLSSDYYLAERKMYLPWIFYLVDIWYVISNFLEIQCELKGHFGFDFDYDSTTWNLFIAQVWRGDQHCSLLIFHQMEDTSLEKNPPIFVLFSLRWYNCRYNWLGRQNVLFLWINMQNELFNTIFLVLTLSSQGFHWGN